MRTRVKICGITNLEDALLAAEAGADALGFVFYRGSKRFVPPATAGEIVRALPPFVQTVGVFVNSPRREVETILETVGLGALQFHGEESVDDCQGWPVPVVRAIRPRTANDLHTLPLQGVDAWLVDAWSPRGRGGTGELADWGLAGELARRARVILAGGLTPHNVAEAVRRVRPYAVDVSSGVERAPGRKDPEKVKAFVEAVLRVSLELEGK